MQSLSLKKEQKLHSDLKVPINLEYLSKSILNPQLPPFPLVSLELTVESGEFLFVVAVE